jgi:hypothetical protein
MKINKYQSVVTTTPGEENEEYLKNLYTEKFE